MQAVSDKVIVAAVQMNPKLKMISENLNTCLCKIEDVAKKGAALIAFPELTLSGYIYENRDEVLSIAETIPGPSINKIAEKCVSLKTHVIIGLIERDNEKIFNSAVLIGPRGILGKYRKTHLPLCGADRFVERGDIPYEVIQTDVGKLGIQICYDVQHPEGVRCLALKGAEIVVNIANYPLGVEFMADFVLHTRVLENRVHILTCDRIGIERGVRFIGTSMILDADNTILSRARGEQIIYAKLDLNKSRIKRKIIKQGENEIDLFNDRRPELYAEICKN